MALTIQTWGRASVSANEPITTLQNGSVIGAPRIYTYVSVDTQAVMAGAGYFNAGVANQGVSQDLVTGDIILGYSKTDATWVWYTAVNTAGVITTSVFAAAAAVGTGNIDNLAVTTAKLADAGVTLAKLAPGVAPSHVIKYANQVTTLGGAAAEVFAVVGALATDRAFVQMVNNGASNVTVVEAVVGAGTLTVTFSADPGAGAIINYQLIRAAS